MENLAPQPVVYHLDLENRIVFTNSEWDEFAQSNQAPNLQGSFIHRSDLFGFIEGDEVQMIYRDLFGRVREKNQTLTIPFRCDSPSQKRYFRLSIEPLPEGGIALSAVLDRREDRDPCRLLDSEVLRSDGFLRTCSWCKRFLIGEDEWVEAEEAIARLRLFEMENLPRMSHSVCPICLEEVSRTILSP